MDPDIKDLFALDNHKIKCPPCVTIMPEEGENILEFRNHHFKSRLPVAVYADLKHLIKKYRQLNLILKVHVQIKYSKMNQ